MTNDRPTSLRMGFGFGEARAAGAPYVAPPTTNQMNWHLRERAAEKELRELREAFPNIGDPLREIISNLAATHTTQTLLFIARCLVADRSETGFVITGSDGKTYEANKVNKIYTDALVIEYQGKPFTLSRYYVTKIVPKTA